MRGSHLSLPQFATPGTQSSSGQLNTDGAVPMFRQVLYTYYLKFSLQLSDVSVNISFL